MSKPSNPFPDGIPDPTAVSGSELTKSKATRLRILEAAVTILADEGYARFSTGAVAARAELTRPAMLYHYGSRLELLTATVHFLVRRRLEMFEAAMQALTLREFDDAAAYRAATLEVTWAQLETMEFRAFSTLAAVARTDPELSEVVEPAILAFDHYREEMSARIFPVGTQEYLALRLARDIVRFLTEGVKQQDSIRIDREARIHALKAFLRELGTTQQGTDLIRKVVDDIAAARDAAGDGDGDG